MHSHKTTLVRKRWMKARDVNYKGMFAQIKWSE